jgi:hypothetical protein
MAVKSQQEIPMEKKEKLFSGLGERPAETDNGRKR